MKILFAFVLLLMIGMNFGKKKGKQKVCSDSVAFGSISHKLFGVRTLYEHIHKMKGYQLPDVSKRTSTESCSPVYTYIVLRHGARYPHKRSLVSQQVLQGFQAFLNSTGKAKLCAKDIQTLRDWKPWVDEYVDKNQTKYGDLEIRKIARRFIKMLPELFPTQASPDAYRFRSSDYQRTIASMRVFAEEIFKRGRNKRETEQVLASANLQVTPVENDTLLRFSKNCPKFQTIVLKNSSRYVEQKRFMKGRILRKMIRRVAARLGVSKERLRPDFIYQMYLDGCALQQWVDAVNGAWCLPFSRKDFKALDYATDLKEFARRTNRDEVTRKMSCDLAKDVVSSLRQAANSDQSMMNHPMGSFGFAHVTTVVSLAANMQFYHEPTLPLRSDNYQRQGSRTFSMSKMIPSAGNLAFVLYKCGNIHEQYKVQVFWNEKKQRIPACANTLCDLQTFLGFNADFVPGSTTECNFDEICANTL